MKIVVDTNIVFSAILNSNGTINDLILNSFDNFSFFAPTFLIEELEIHHKKLKQISSFGDSDLNFLKRTIFHHIEFIDSELVKSENWEKAFDLVHDIDEKDTPFVALALELNATLWTGDKKLISGLKNKNIDLAISTNGIQEIRK